MKIAPLFSEKTVFSFEVFPPKKTSPIETVYQTLEELQDLHPDFISVTLGAGGSGNGDHRHRKTLTGTVWHYFHVPSALYSLHKRKN